MELRRPFIDCAEIWLQMNISRRVSSDQRSKPVDQSRMQATGSIILGMGRGRMPA
ncbi:mCG1027697 [Mus musculus]|jgi:hypothetical protein|nr:mCG1027697 [Mus musculus]